jgi:hypothetical protein
MFSAAKSLKVPTIELQHGASNSNTILWSYPSSISSSHLGLSLPTAYLTFSEFWKGNSHYPVKVLDSIGNDYFYQEKINGSSDGVLIVSAYMYRTELLQLALELAKSAKDKLIYFKLHPHEFAVKNSLLDAFCMHANIIVICDEMDFPSLFKVCNYVVGIHSTTLYIALQAGKKVCIYKRSNYFWHDDIFEYVELFNNVTELRDIIYLEDRYFPKMHSAPIFFQPFDNNKFNNILSNGAF